MSGALQFHDSPAFEHAKMEIAKRIQRVCEHFNESDFAKLVERMAEIEVKYRLREDWLLQTSSRARLSYS